MPFKQILLLYTECHLLQNMVPFFVLLKDKHWYNVIKKTDLGIIMEVVFYFSSSDHRLVYRIIVWHFFSLLILRINKDLRLTDRMNESSENSFQHKLKIYKCKQCDKCFNKSGLLSRHEKIHTGEKPYVCNQCGRRFNRAETLQKHIRAHTGEKPYTCDQCGQKFGQSWSLKRHKIRAHTTEKKEKNICDQCGKSYIHPANLRRHLKVHSGEEERIECDECGKCFSQASALYRHKRAHAGDRPFECSYCGRNFGRLEVLQIHIRRHTGERPFTCDQCGKNFRQASTLRTHQNAHAKEMTVVTCDECGRSFSYKELNRRERKRLIDKRFTCEKCYDEDKKPTVCDVCHKTFSQAAYLQRHKSTFCSKKQHESQNDLYSLSELMTHVKKEMPEWNLQTGINLVNV